MLCGACNLKKFENFKNTVLELLRHGEGDDKNLFQPNGHKLTYTNMFDLI